MYSTVRPVLILQEICVFFQCILFSHEIKTKFSTVEPVYNGHPWDHAEWLLYRGGLLIEVGSALGLY